MHKKTKIQLIEIIENLQNKVEQLENDVDYWEHEYNELDEELDEELDVTVEELENLQIDNGIFSIDNFKFELTKSGLLHDKLENFIDEYLKYKNYRRDEK